MPEQQEKDEQGGAGKDEQPKIQTEQDFAVGKMALSGLGPGQVPRLEFRVFQQEVHHVVERLPDLFVCPAGLFRHAKRVDMSIVKRPAEDRRGNGRADGEQRQQQGYENGKNAAFHIKLSYRRTCG